MVRLQILDTLHTREHLKGAVGQKWSCCVSVVYQATVKALCMIFSSAFYMVKTWFFH